LSLKLMVMGVLLSLARGAVYACVKRFCGRCVALS
jgi:hypothetical protein